MKNILIVEDDKLLRDVLNDRLMKEGYSVVLAENGHEGLSRLVENHIDLVLLDIVMPKMDGIEMAYHMIQSGITKIPIIILTNLTNFAFPTSISEVLIKSNTSLDDIIRKIRSFD